MTIGYSFNHNAKLAAALLVITFWVSACGQKGSLYLPSNVPPSQQPPTPAANNPDVSSSETPDTEVDSIEDQD